MGNDRYAKAPLLYIHQAKTDKVNAKMQHHYMGSNKTKNTGNATDEHVLKSKPVRQRARSFYESEEEKNDREDTPFKEMTLKEKLDYITNRPDYAPRLTCEVRTDDRSYRGIILEYKDGKATMRTGRRRVEIPYENMKQIRLLGL